LVSSIRFTSSTKHISSVNAKSDERFTTFGTFANVVVIKNLDLFSSRLTSELGKILLTSKKIPA